MKFSPPNSGLPQNNPIANVFVVIVGTLAIAAFIVLGFFAFLLMAGVVLVMAATIGVRIWWFKRKLRGARPEGNEAAAKTPGGIIEGEFEVVADEDKGE